MTVDVGWFLDTPVAGAAFGDPIPLNVHSRIDPTSSKMSPDHCPAFQAMKRGMYVIPAPYSLTLFCRDAGSSFEFSVDRRRSSISPPMMQRFVRLLPQADWRSPRRPIIQASLPYVFVSDTDVQLEQLPPILFYQDPPWPGVQITGEFPIRNWPRNLSWAFEWHDFNTPLVVRASEPYCLVRLRAASGEAIKLRHIQKTETIANYQKQIKGVANIAKGTFHLMDKAAERRPESLLSPANEIENG